MTSNEAKSVIIEIFQEIFPEVIFNKINPDRPLREEVDMDSYDIYRIMVFLAQKTGVTIPDSKIPELKSINAIIKYIIGQPTHRLPQSPDQ